MPEETKRVELVWEGDLRFRGGEPGGPTVLVDASGVAAPGPMAALLLAAAACSAADVVHILGRMRVGLYELRVEAAGRRREQEPRRYLAVHLVYRLRGRGLDEAKARRAVELSIQRYCSVIHSLAPDIALTHELSLA